MSVLEVVRRMHVYNRWANGQMLAALSGMATADLVGAAPVSYGNVGAAVWHLAGAQLGWLQICSGLNTWERAPVADGSSVNGLSEMCEASHAMWSEFIDSLSEERVLRPVELPVDDNFRRSVGSALLAWTETRRHRPLRPLWQSMLHVANHSTQHRAEIGVHLAMLGRSPGDLDYGTFEENRVVLESL